MSARDETTPVLTLLQHIQAGTLSPKALDRDARLDVVEALGCEGYTQYAIAQILHCSDRTVRRDLQAIRERNALHPAPEFVVHMAGELLRDAERRSAGLVRLARDTTASVSERAQAEFFGWKIKSELVQRLQSLGYLPTQPTTVVTDVTVHGDGGVPSFRVLHEELVALDCLAKDAGADTPQAQAERQRLRAEVERGRLAERIVEQQRQLDTEIEHDAPEAD